MVQSCLSDGWWSDANGMPLLFAIAWPMDEHRVRTTIQRTVRWSDQTVRSRDFLQSHLAQRQTPSSPAYRKHVVGHLHWVRSAHGRWTGCLPIADLDDLEKNIASGVHVDRLRSQEVQVTTAQGICLFPRSDGSLKQAGHVLLRPLHQRYFKKGQDAGGKVS